MRSRSGRLIRPPAVPSLPLPPEESDDEELDPSYEVDEDETESEEEYSSEEDYEYEEDSVEEGEEDADMLQHK